MLQKLLGNKFEWIKHTSQFNEDFMQKYLTFESDIQYPKILHKLYNGFSFLSERGNLKKSKRWLLVYLIKLNMLFT